LLQLFIEAFGGSFQQPLPAATRPLDARARLKQVLNRTLVSGSLGLSFSDVVSNTGCSPRHVSRLFKELVGVSFRDKQTELRLARACKLLATTDSKVVDVAMESGYQSTSLFSAMFKQRFGRSPAKWRLQAKRRKRGNQPRRLRIVA
jgi:transcriptional regulator GlxA family with amidase domain